MYGVPSAAGARERPTKPATARIVTTYGSISMNWLGTGAPTTDRAPWRLDAAPNSSAASAALLFGAASNLQGALSVVGAPVPSQFMLMLPYVVTILAVAGFVGRSRAPAADGTPYIEE